MLDVYSYWLPGMQVSASASATIQLFVDNNSVVQPLTWGCWTKSQFGDRTQNCALHCMLANYTALGYRTASGDTEKENWLLWLWPLTRSADISQTALQNYTQLLRFISGREEAIHRVLDTLKAKPIMNSSILGKKYQDIKFYLFNLLVCVSSFRQPLWFYSYPTNETIVMCTMEGYFYNPEAVWAIQSVYIWST